MTFRAGVLPVGDADAAAVRVDDRHHPTGGGEGHIGPGRHAHIHHAVQGEVRHQDHHARGFTMKITLQS